jgi:hypothetical protein
MRPQRIALKDHGELAPLRRERGDVTPKARDGTRHHRLEAGDGAQQRCLATPGGAKDGNELARRYVEVDVVEHHRTAVAGSELRNLEGRPPAHARPPLRGA